MRFRTPFRSLRRRTRSTAARAALTAVLVASAALGLPVALAGSASAAETAAQRTCSYKYINTPYTHAGGEIYNCNFRPYRVLLVCRDGFTGNRYNVYGSYVRSGYSKAYCNSQRATADAVLIG